MRPLMRGAETLHAMRGWPRIKPTCEEPSYKRVLAINCLAVYVSPGE